MTDTRMAYGFSCTWWNVIAEVGLTGPAPGFGSGPKNRGIPCCPQCKGMLYEMPTEGQWMAQAKKYEKAGHAGYVDFIVWLRGKCFTGKDHLEKARAAYKTETGKEYAS